MQPSAVIAPRPFRSYFRLDELRAPRCIARSLSSVLARIVPGQAISNGVFRLVKKKMKLEWKVGGGPEKQ